MASSAAFLPRVRRIRGNITFNLGRSPSPAVCHSGFGLGGIENPAKRVGPMRHLIRPVFDPEENRDPPGRPARRATHRSHPHLDMDHAGGMSDFPHAQVHTTAAELLAAVVAPDARARARYRSAQFAHGPTWVEHTTDGEPWLGFAAAKELTSIAPGIVLVSLPGHSQGHACIAVDAGDQWLLHAGDAFYHWGALGGDTPVPPLVKAMERVAVNYGQLVANQQRLAELHRDATNVRVVSAHDPADLDAFIHPNLTAKESL